METKILGSQIDVVGVKEIEVGSDGRTCFSRLPNWTKSQYAKGDIGRWARMPSGVRLRFATEATELSMVVHVYRLTIKGLAEEKGPADFDLLVNGQEFSTQPTRLGGEVRLTMDGPAVTDEEYVVGENEIITFPALPTGMKEIEIWLPSSGIVEIFSVNSNSELLAPHGDTRKKWIHYGSSISHCIEAERPMNIWSVHASRLLDLNLANLGLAGECHLDGFVARTIADQKVDFISLKLGINVVNADSMRERAFVPAFHNFIDTIREKQPKTPILVISPIICPFHEENPGPTLIGATGLFSRPREHDLSHGALNLPRIRQLLEAGVAKRSDQNLHYLNGLELFNQQDVHMMPDLLHPNATGYRLMGERFAAKYADFINQL